MEGHRLVIGRTYAFREKRSSDSPLFKIKLLDKVGRKGKLKVRFEDGPHPGLEDYVSTRQIVTTWGERKALLRDEEREQRLAEYEQSHGDKALGDAIDAVLAATGEPGSGYHEAELQRILDRAGLETPPADVHPLGYIDRHGVAHLPLESLAVVAKAFAAAEPETVIGYLDDEEEELRLRGNQPASPARARRPVRRLCASTSGLPPEHRCGRGLRFALHGLRQRPQKPIHNRLGSTNSRR